jgi:hypothetical protein
MSFLFSYLSQTTRFTFPLQQAENIALPDGSLDVPDNRTARTAATTFGIHKFDAHLRDVTSISGTSEDAVDLGEFDGLILS